MFQFHRSLAKFFLFFCIKHHYFTFRVLQYICQEIKVDNMYICILSVAFLFLSLFTSAYSVTLITNVWTIPKNTSSLEPRIATLANRDGGHVWVSVVTYVQNNYRSIEFTRITVKH